MSVAVQPRMPRGVSLAWVARSGLAVWVIVGAAILGLTAADPAGFWSAANVANVLTACVVLGLVALGQNVVVLTGGIDLSVGSTATVAALMTAIAIDGFPIRTWPVVLGVLALGALIGIGHGLLVARVGLAAFVVTLATFYALQGVAFSISTQPTGQVTQVLSDFALQRVGPFPLVLSVLLAAIALVAWLLHRTPFGRHVYAVGGDEASARAAGVPVRRTIVGAYALCGGLAALAGIVLAARATVGSPTAGEGLELQAITVVVLGGTALLGGRGRLIGTLGGVVLLALLETGFTLVQAPGSYYDLIRGLVIVAAAAVFVGRVRR